VSAHLSARELTAPGPAAIRVLALSGPGALERVARLAGARASPAPGEYALLALRDARGALLDEALALVLDPGCVELHLHGGPAIVERVLDELGIPLREPEPRTLEQRADARLAAAASEAAARVLLDQAQGALRGELEALLRLSDDELGARSRALALRGRVARRLLEPPRVVLAGSVNAGKSTLFNALVGRERVVVDAAPGTTRDAVRERVQLGAYAVELFDSAGERALGAGEEGTVERAGQTLAAELRRAADLVLWLVPPGGETPRELPPRTRLVRSCADLARAGSARGPWPEISAKLAPSAARARVEELVHAALELPRDPWVPGAGVPFEPEWVERLEREEPAALRRSVRSWLALPD
jgi:tRNA modification GTPase